MTTIPGGEMVHVVFVHGTGVREPAFTEALSTVRAGLKAAIPGVTVHPCYWAGTCGSDIGEGLSIPLYAQAMGDDVITPADEALSEWAILLEDPLLELRLLASRSGEDDGVPGPGPAHALRLQLAEVQRLLSLHQFAGLEGENAEAFLASLVQLLAMPEFDNAIINGVQNEVDGADPLDPVRMVVARAAVAGWLVALLDLQKLAPMAKRRDELVQTTYVKLGGSIAQQLGLLDDLRSVLLAPLKVMMRQVVIDPSLRMAAWGGRRYRHTLANAATPAAGDVLLYQARGKPIRNFITATAEAVGQPVVLLAHSLGGIACVDLLIEQSHPNIRGIITAGSQAPFFYEIGALTSRARGAPMPSTMPPWLNIYDKNDLLSFLASPLMQGKDNQVSDVSVDSGQPFPASHSAYWSNPAVWEASAKFISALP